MQNGQLCWFEHKILKKLLTSPHFISVMFSFKMLSSVRKCKSVKYRANLQQIYYSIGLFRLYQPLDGQVVMIEMFALSAKEWKNRLSSSLHFPCVLLCQDRMPALVRWLALDPVVLYISFSSNIVKKQSPRFIDLYIAWSLVLFHLLCNLLLLLYCERSQPNPQISSWVVMSDFLSISSQRYLWEWQIITS